MTTIGTTSDNELRVTTSGHSFRLIFLFCELREEPATNHPKQDSLNLEEDLEEGPLN